MEIPNSQKPATTFQACPMRISPIRRMNGHHTVPEYWQPNLEFHGQQFQAFVQNGSSIYPAPYPKLCPGFQCWGSSPTKWRQEVPSEMPWIGRSQGVQSFKGLSLCSSSSLESPPVMAFKRRLEKEEEPCSKHLVTEDMMADRFNHLSLENDHTYSDNGFLPQAFQEWKCSTDQKSLSVPSGTEAGEGREENVVLEGEFSMGEAPTLILSTVLQESLREPGLKNILPEQVQYSLNYPCMELVLWKPPGSLIQKAIHSLRRQQDSSPESSNKTGISSSFFSQLNTNDLGASQQKGILQQELEDRMEQ
ncbi:host cell factor C1 regulator 1 [Microcaecilia unicolor]|uniref:Host cell factor C1 regulator 1 n=1 Tax=Microcaecilia unicolor TaxID=1415580 RepID=A0A6P7YD22_9AMPH|nr:host cell factor C1 regulator 1 [Microcaecilia unicolor]XP_030065383.1 host cell factor C1 regulator 1 [Microcaecilia unicolor]XP_030065384.1 host cell factor C1 regulator 1 [Microcaecilia unicolor]